MRTEFALKQHRAGRDAIGPLESCAILSGKRKCVDANPAGICGRLLPDDGGVLSSGAGRTQGQLKPTKIRATTVTSTMRARVVSMAAVPNGGDCACRQQGPCREAQTSVSVALPGLGRRSAAPE